MKPISVETLVASQQLSKIYIEKRIEDYTRLLDGMALLEDDNDVIILFQPGSSALPMVFVEVFEHHGETLYYIKQDFDVEIGAWTGPEFQTFEQLAAWWLMKFW